jgi:hypothetical protein
MLKSLLKKGIGLLPEKYRGLAQKALSSLGLDDEVQSEGFDLELEGGSLDELYGVDN